MNRLYGVMNRRLAGRDYIAGPYSIADMACFPWIRPHERQGQKIEDFPLLKAWLERMNARPAVQRGLQLAKEVQGSVDLSKDKQARQVLFGQRAT